jgi:hypothetical protein
MIACASLRLPWLPADRLIAICRPRGRLSFAKRGSNGGRVKKIVIVRLQNKFLVL